MTTVVTKKTIEGLNKRQRFRRLVLNVTAGLALFTPLFFVIAALGSRFGIWDWRFAFGTLIRNVGMKLLLATLAAGLISLLLVFVIKPRKGLFIALLGIAVPLVGMTHAKSVRSTAAKLPFIHDVSTDTQDPPQFTSKLANAPDRVNSLDYSSKRMGANKTLNSVLQVKGYPDIRTLIREETPEEMFNKAEAAVKLMGWNIAKSDASEGIIEATDTTFWFGFKDDVVIRIREGKGGGSVLDIRSVSRVGGSDIGANAERIREFFDAL